MALFDIERVQTDDLFRSPTGTGRRHVCRVFGGVHGADRLSVLTAWILARQSVRRLGWLTTHFAERPKHQSINSLVSCGITPSNLAVHWPDFSGGLC